MIDTNKEKIHRWLEEFQEIECKIPDTETDCEINRCIGGIID